MHWASSNSSNSSKILFLSNLASPKLPFNPQEFTKNFPNFSKSSPSPDLGFQLPTMQCSYFFKFLWISSRRTSTLTKLLSLQIGLFTTSANVLFTAKFPPTFSSCMLSFLPIDLRNSCRFSAIEAHPSFSPLPFGM